MQKIRIVTGADREKTLEQVLQEIETADGIVVQVIWKERAGYWVVRYTTA